MTSFPWPVSFLPALQQAGVYPLDENCRGPYIGATVALHLHDYFATILIGREKIRIQPGDITISPARVTSHYALKEKGTHLCLHFQPAPALRGAAGRLRLPIHLRLGPNTAGARDRFWRVIDYYRQAGARADAVVRHAGSAALQELLLWLALHTGRGATPHRGSRVDDALKKLRASVDASIARPASIADLAAGAGLSPAYLARVFAQSYGMTVQQYLLQRRIELARHLLTASDLLVAEIGDRVGLPDPQYFNKQFRRVAGVSPVAYRRSLQNRA